MKHSRKTKLISWMLVVVMLLSYFPVGAQAVDSTTDIKAIQKPTGYYSLPGTVTLPAGATNVKNLKVSIPVQVLEYKKPGLNPSVENGRTSWYLRDGEPDPSCVQGPIKDGKYAAMSGGLQSAYKEMSFADTRKMDERLYAFKLDYIGNTAVIVIKKKKHIAEN